MSLHDIWKGDVMPESGVAVAIGRNSFDPPAPTVPVHDIHHRSTILHDSAGPESGVVQYDGYKNHMQLIGSNSGAAPVVTNIVYYAHDTAGGSGVGTTAGLVAFPVTVTSMPEGYFYNEIMNGEVILWTSGTYDVDVDVTYEPDTGTRTTSRLVASYKEPGDTAYTTIAGASAYGYHRNTANGEDTIPMSFIMPYVKPGTRLRITGIVVAGSTGVTQVAQSSRIRIRKLSG